MLPCRQWSLSEAPNLGGKREIGTAPSVFRRVHILAVNSTWPCLTQLQRALISISEYVDKFIKANRRLDLPAFASLTHLQQLQFALGNLSPHLLKKDYKLWMEVVVPLCAKVACALRRHLESLVSSVTAQTFACRRRNKRARKTSAAGSSHPPGCTRKSATHLAGSPGKAPVTGSGGEESQSSDVNTESNSPWSRRE